MTVRTIVPFPDKRLRKVADPVDDITDDVHAIWQDMIDTMEAMPGVGLAAPQIGVMLSLAVVDASDTRGQVIRLANPKIVAASDKMRAHDEASPHLPGVHARLERPQRVTVRFIDETGATVDREFANIWSTSVQHQIDHLNGRLYIDSLSRTKREMLIRKSRKVTA